MENKHKRKKSIFLSICQGIIVGISIFICLIAIVIQKYSLLGTTIAYTVILYITMNIFKIIIDLLQSIEEKI